MFKRFIYRLLLTLLRVIIDKRVIDMIMQEVLRLLSNDELTGEEKKKKVFEKLAYNEQASTRGKSTTAKTAQTKQNLPYSKPLLSSVIEISLEYYRELFNKK